LKAKKNSKRDEAYTRQEAYDNLSLDKKLASLIPGGSNKQRKKLETKKAVVSTKK
jgi:hypothetical protein